MLRWEMEDRGYYLGYSGDEEAASVVQLESTGEWGFEILEREATQGQRLTLKEAKSAAEAAFTAWLQSADLVHLPDGYQIVPVEPTPGMIGAWYSYKSGYHCPNEPPPRDTSDYGAYRAMLAAAKTAQDGRER